MDKPLSPDELTAEALTAALAGEMIQSWRQGERVLPEELLARHPRLGAYPEAAIDLIYEELCLRQEHGPPVSLDQVLRRFPQWRPQLEVLFDCQQLLGPRPRAPDFPVAGEPFGDFQLLAELGRGAQARVFLAQQRSLGDRPVVVKLAPREACEHLSLARLQHSHIVPLYSVHDQPARGLRALCMPYFGGATLAQLLAALRSVPAERRTGKDLVDALDALARPADRGARTEERGLILRSSFLAPRSSSYVHAVCWIGTCLADALAYAHARGLVHLDLKPSNVLVAADGQPMLLDFHLARAPIAADGHEPLWLGGTPGYMAPEQRAAITAIAGGRPIAQPVDGRADIYALGVLLGEALGGPLPAADRPPGSTTTARHGKVVIQPEPAAAVGVPRSLRRANPRVSAGLADVIGKCLAHRAEQRYPHVAALAADLRRHLADLPLAGVRNRSLAERWGEWRRRRPYGLALVAMTLAVLLAAGAGTVAAVSDGRRHAEQVRTALRDGQRQMANREWDEAVRTLERGRAAAGTLPFQQDLADALERQRQLAAQGRAAARRRAAVDELHRLADRARFRYGVAGCPAQELRGLAAACAAFWDRRDRIVARLGAPLESAARDDLLDLAIFWADLQVRLAPAADRAEAHARALAVLDQAETLFGPGPVLDAERALHGALPAGGARPPQTAWEHYALARALLRAGAPARAAAEADRAVRLQPQGLWPNFYQGLCAYRLGRHADAALAFSVCIGAAPEAAGCFYNRALALAALGNADAALDDYDTALRLDPTLAVAALNRGMLHYVARRYPAALADLQRARALGADAAAVAFDLALVYLAQGDRTAALASLRVALGHDSRHAGARQLRDRLQP